MDLTDKWTTVSNHFNPRTPLSRNEYRLDRCFVEREGRTWQRLKIRLHPDREKLKILLAGQQGCGKTSELFKLMSEVKNDYLTIYVDVSKSYELATISQLELVFLIGAAVYKSAQNTGIKLPKKLWENLVSCFETLVCEVKYQSDFKIDPAAFLSSVFSTAGFSYPGTDIVGSLGFRGVIAWLTAFRRHILDKIAAKHPDIASNKCSPRKVPKTHIVQSSLGISELEPSLGQIVTRINTIIKEVEEKSSQKRLLLIVDGLDKVRKDEKAESIFFERGWALRQIQCRAVYTLPIVLYQSTRFYALQEEGFGTEVLHNVRLYERGKHEQLNTSGHKTIRNLVERRLESVGMEVHHVFAPGALDQLIKMSGGLMDCIVELVQQSALEAELMEKPIIEQSTAQRAINKICHDMETGLLENHYRALEEIKRSGLINQDDDAHMDLITNAYVVNYNHDDFWRGIHPLVLLILEKHRAKVTTQPTAFTQPALPPATSLLSSAPNTQLDSILIVTVTKVEAQAVLDVFSQAAGTRWTRQVIGKKTYYNLGTHGGVPVFMVQSEMGIATPGGALVTVRQAIQDLHPQAVIMCGIAFGLRPDKQQLGDILVAKQIQYYEPQKVDIQRGQMPRGDRTTSAERLLDRFRSGDLDWQGAPRHFGLVLSGENLVNDPAFRNWLLEIEPGAVGGEMEGAGLYVAARDAKVDWILVKAICDWADGNKNDDAQPPAASNAAQFVLYVLQLGGWGGSEQLRARNRMIQSQKKGEHEPELISLRRQLQAREEGLRLVQERRAEYVLETDIPLTLIKEERKAKKNIEELKRRIEALE